MKTSRYLPEPTKRNSIRARRTRSVAGGDGFALLCSGKVLELGRMKRLLGWVDTDRTGRPWGKESVTQDAVAANVEENGVSAGQKVMW